MTKIVITDWKLGRISSFSLLIIIWQTYDQAFETNAFTSVKGNNMVFMVFISISLYIVWISVSLLTSLLWLDKEDTIAIAYCKSIFEHSLPVLGLSWGVQLVSAATTLGDPLHDSMC